MKETSKLYKLIVLYTLSRVDFPMTTSQLSEFILDKGYTTYFTFHQILSQLVETDMVWELSTYNRTLYSLTESGAETISLLEREISPKIIDDINVFLNEKKYDLKSEVAIKSDYYKCNSFEYIVRCQVIEKDQPIIDLSLQVPSKEEAEKIANNWNAKNQEIYTMLMEKLLS